MFEQNLQDQEKAPRDQPQVQLFEDYEIKNWRVSTRIYKILGLSIILNLIAMLTMGQTNLMTRKGCDSPLVGSVCQVLDMVYLGSDVLGTNTQFVEGEFTHTDLGDADITYINLTGQDPPLKYPDGYFALANPGEFVEQIETGEAGIPFPTNIPGISAPRPNLAAQPQVTPTPGKIEGELPTDVYDTGNPAIAGVNPPVTTKGPRGLSRNGRNPGKTPKPTPSTDPTASAGVTTSEGLPSIVIKKDALRKLGADVKVLVEQKKVDLNAAFNVSATGRLDKDGKIVSFKYNSATSTDEGMIGVIQSAIEAVNDSGYLQYLTKLSGKDLNLTIGQDNDFTTGIVESEVETPRRADNMKALFKMWIAAKVSEKINSDKPDDKDDLEILKNATVETDGKKLIIKFAVPKAVAQELIQRKLIDNQAAQEPQKPGATTQTPVTNPTGGK